MNEIIRAKREYYLQVKQANDVWMSVYPHEPLTFDAAMTAWEKLASNCIARITEVETIERVVQQ